MLNLQMNISKIWFYCSKAKIYPIHRGQTALTRDKLLISDPCVVWARIFKAQVTFWMAKQTKQKS